MRMERNTDCTGDATPNIMETFNFADRMRFQSLLHGMVEELKMRRELDIENEKKIKKLLNDKFSLGWKWDQSLNEISSLNQQHSVDLRESKRKNDDKIREHKIEVSQNQMYKRLIEKERDALRQEMTKLQLTNYSLEKQSREAERLEKMLTEEREEHLKQVSEFENQRKSLMTDMKKLTEKQDKMGRDYAHKEQAIDESYREACDETMVNDQTFDTEKHEHGHEKVLFELKTIQNNEERESFTEDDKLEPQDEDIGSDYDQMETSFNGNHYSTASDQETTDTNVNSDEQSVENETNERNFDEIPISDNESISNSNDPHQHESTVPDDEKLFPESRLSLGSFMVLMMTFILKYSLTGDALGDLLRIIDLICPSVNNVTKSIVSFKKWFKYIKHPLKIHKYCTFCNVIVTEEDKICPNALCRKVLNDSNLSHFIEIPIVEQIKSFFSRPTFYEDIQYRFRRRKKCPDSIEDIYDGEVYKALSQTGGFLDNTDNISLLWNTDGIPCFKSSNMSLWPLFFQINELPYNKRINHDNMILGGLWFGPKKPTMISYTEPFVKTLQDLENKGVKLSVGNKTITCKVAVIGGTADLPARSIVCNTIQFNGKYGCCKCLQPGSTCKTSERGHCHIFPFLEENPTGPKRSHGQFLLDVEDSVKNNEISRGIKGPSFLQCLSFYNLVNGTCIDYMHGVLLGVTKLLMSLWFLPEHNGKLFSLSTKVPIIDKYLSNLKPPNTITRLPRSIKDHLKYWKASEFRSWLLYYSLPILRDLQTKDYFQHYLLFVNAIFILLQDSITPDEISKSEALLTHFCCLFAALYGDRYMTCNVHQLLHLPEMVLHMGPLWAYSCFPFENANGKVLNFFNGTQNVDFQIVETVSLMQSLPILQAQFLEKNSLEDFLYQSMKGSLDRHDHSLQENIYMIGSSGKKRLSVKEMEAVSHYLGYIPQHYITFNRIRIGSEIFHSKCYRRVYARNSYTVACILNEEIEILQVSFFMQLYLFCDEHPEMGSACKCKFVNVAIASLLKRHPDLAVRTMSADILSGANVSYIHVLQKASLEKFVVVPLDSILYKCVFVDIDDQSSLVYACKMPNYFEKD